MTETSLDLLRWRLLLPIQAELPDPDDQVDWAGLFATQGFADAALLLCRSAFLRQGFSPQLRAEQARALARHGLARAGEEPVPPAGPPTQGTMERAVAELAELARLPLTARRPGPAAPAPDQAGDVAQSVEALHQLLAGPAPASAEGWQDADRLLARLRQADRSLPAFDYRRHADAAPPLLAALIATAGLHDFLHAAYDLAFSRLGSATLLRHVARLDSFGLGPYLSNMPRLARNSRDVFDLARIAHAAAAEAGSEELDVETWVAFLSRRLGGALLDEVVDDLGDLAADGALTTILDRASALPDRRVNLALVARVRDAGLDNGHYDLAARAQGVIARCRPGNWLEQQILGSIQASGGDFIAAEQTFRALLPHAPEEAGIPQRLRAVRAESFEPYLVSHGFGTPRGRQEVRLRRRNGVRPTSAVRAARTMSVELY